MNKYTRWSQVPENLKTKTQLSKDGLKPGDKPVATIQTGYGNWELYDSGNAVKKRKMSDAQKTALEKARTASEKRRCCDECGLPVLSPGKRRLSSVLLCDYCKHERFLARERKDAAAWAKRMLSEKTIILDTEITGLGDDAQIIEIAICDVQGNCLLNRMVKPTVPIEPGTSAIHGITNDDVATLPGWGFVWPDVRAVIINADNLVIYNRDFDMRMINQSCRAIGVRMFDVLLSDPLCKKMGLWCAMRKYAAWYGEWSDYHNSFTWLPLNGGHRALDDCLATLELLKDMAGG